jgi:hypothetical protein
MLLSVTKAFALHHISRQAASDRAKIVRAHKIAVALYYIGRQAGSDLRLTYGRYALSNKATWPRAKLIIWQKDIDAVINSLNSATTMAVCNRVYGSGVASCLLAHVSWSDKATNRAIKQIAPNRIRDCKPIQFTFLLDGCSIHSRRLGWRGNRDRM